MKYSHLTQPERITLYQLGESKFTLREIATRMRRSPSSLSREWKRNGGRKSYNPHHANIQAHNHRKRAKHIKITAEIWREILVRLKQGYTPEQVSGQFKLEGIISISAESIYKRLYKEAKEGGKSYQYLPRAGRQRKPRFPRRKNPRKSHPPSLDIDNRPAEVEGREQVGHWEGDLVAGKRNSGYFVTLVERKTLMVKIGKVETKEAAPVNEMLIRLLKEVPQWSRKSVTFDNGKEFRFFNELKRETNTKVFFAHPYHSWERGSNENFNGLLRRDYPKGKVLSGVTEYKASKLEEKWNNIPRKSLNWLTPLEAMSLESERRKSERTEVPDLTSESS